MRSGYWITVVGDFPEAVRISDRVESEEAAMQDTFGLHYDPKRHIAMFATTRVRDLQTDRTRGEMVRRAMELWRQKNANKKEEGAA